MGTKQKRKKVAAMVVLCAMLVYSLIAIGGNLEPSAAPGPTMKTLDEVEPRVPIQTSDLPLTITEPNSYYLVEDVNFTDDANHAITIECNDVTIDLMGYTIKGPDSGTKYGIYMDGRTNVEVRNGTVRDFYYSIYEASHNLGRHHRVINVRVVSNANRGISLYGKGHLIKDCTVAEHAVYGIFADSGSTVTGNTAYDNGSYGIGTGSGSTVTGNTCRDNGSYGIATFGSTVTGNACYDNADYGIYADAGCTVTGNTAYENQSHGIKAGTGCTIIGNAARLNTGNGIDFDGLGTVADNTADRNGGHGIYVNSGAVVARNSCCENGGDGIYGSDGNRIMNNNCVGNGRLDVGAGIHTGSLRNVIVDNTVTQNDRGIDVDSTGSFIGRNTATMNTTTDYDIAGNNSYGPIVNVTSVGDITSSGDPNAAHPWANFEF